MFGERELRMGIELSVTRFAVKIADSLTFIILMCLCKTNNLLGAKSTAGINFLIYQPTFMTPFLLWPLVLNPTSASSVKAFPKFKCRRYREEKLFPVVADTAQRLIMDFSG